MKISIIVVMTICMLSFSDSANAQTYRLKFHLESKYQGERCYTVSYWKNATPTAFTLFTDCIPLPGVVWVNKDWVYVPVWREYPFSNIMDFAPISGLSKIRIESQDGLENAEMLFNDPSKNNNTVINCEINIKIGINGNIALSRKQ